MPTKGKGIGLLFLFGLLMGTAPTALAGTYSCGPGGDFQVLDGYHLADVGLSLADFDKLSSLSFVGDCTIRNFPQDNGIGGFGVGSTLLNFNLPDKQAGATIVLDNVYYPGNMSCSNLAPSVIIWWVNGAWNSIDAGCQDFLPPYLDALRKLNPAGQTTQSIGVPFTYTLTVPELVTLNTDGSYTWQHIPDTDPLTYVRIEDDLAATGADLSYVSYNAYLADPDGGNPTPFTFDVSPSAGAKQLVFESGTPDSTSTLIPAGKQLFIELTVVLDDTSANSPGVTFSNEVDWYLSKNVTNSGGGTAFVQGVPGHTEATDPMTIVGPYLQVAKTSPISTLSAGESAPFTIDARNSGAYDAWDPVIVDQIPAGMCFNDPTPGLTAQLVDTDGTTVLSTLVKDKDYALNWTGGTTNTACQITLTTTGVKIAPQQHVIIHYDAILDTAPTSGALFTNVASADYWYNGDSSITTRKEYHEPATDGTTGDNTDSQDAHTITSRAPYLQVSKTSTVTTLNVGVPAPYTIDVYNTDDGSAWDPVIVDLLPQGMCVYDATSKLTAQLVDTDGTTVLSTLDPSTQYTLNWTGGSPTSACQFTLTTTNIEIGPQQHLIINYDAQLDAGVTSGVGYTNVASADYWYNAASSVTTRSEYHEPATDGTTGDNTDSQDAYTVTAAVAGYYFLKSVANLTTGVSAATTAFPGDTLRYTLQIQNFTKPPLAISAITDEMDAAFEPGTLVLHFSDLPVAPTVDPTGGTNGTGSISVPAFTLDSDTGYELQFDITLKSSLPNGSVVPNQAKLSGTYSGGTLTDALSDNPYQNGAVELITSDADPTLREDTSVTIDAPGVLSKHESTSQVTIGDTFTYTITVPETPVGVGLYDVKVVDDFAKTGAALIVNASATLKSGAQSWTNLSYGLDSAVGDYVLQDTAGGGIDIPPGDQAIITVSATLDNAAVNNTALTPFINSAYYIYNKKNGVDSPGVGGTGQSGAVSVVEPDLTVNKTVTNLTTPGEPAQTGQTLRYTVEITNSSAASASAAYDVSIVDTLPSNVLLDTSTVKASIGGSPVTGFNPVPTTSGGAKIWGNRNGDGSLDIGVGETLTLTYDVFVLSVDGTPIENSVNVDWSSLDGVKTYERTGADCLAGNTSGLNDYCFGPTVAPIDTTDTNTIVKSILDDSNTNDTSVPPVVRVGDTVTYQLAVKLHEGVTANVVVEDTLPPGMELTGPPTISHSAGASFSPYTVTTTPSDPLGAGDSGTLRWNFGDIENLSSSTNPDGTDKLDEIQIAYTAVVVTDSATGVAHVPAITDPDSTNHATLAYSGGDPNSTDPAVYDRLNETQRVNIHQPIMTPISKVDYGTGRTGTGTSGDPYQVDIATDTMNFRLQTCNDTGRAPAYNLAIRDTLPAELDPATMPADPVVKIGSSTDPTTATAATAGTDYTYNLTGGQIDVTFNDGRPIAPGECVFVEYDIGFADNIAPNTTPWFNTAEVVKYWSLPTSSGREYTPVDTDSVYMTNTATLADPVKAIAQPVPPTSTVTIGEEVHYTITIPATNANLTNVVVTDALDPALTYLGATEAGGLSLDDSATSGQNVSITIGSIPAGQDAVITLRAQVVDDPAIAAGYTFDNQASYTYNGTTRTSPLAGLLTIVEPASLAPTKTVSPTTPPTAGDTLTYTITIPAQSAPNSSQAFDLTVVDTLGDGLSYASGTAQINGMTVAAPLPNPALGTDTNGLQTLTWAGLDIPYNQEVTITYNVVVQDSVVPNQTLTNSADITWTSLDTAVTGERTYTSTVSTTLTAADTASLTKAVVADSYVDANPAAPSTATDKTVRVGDTVDYQLTLNLQEGTTRGVTVTDQLPTGLVFDSLQNVAAGTGITYSTNPIAVTTNASGVTFALGDVVHTPDADTDDAIVITYRARVLKDTLAHQATITAPDLRNSATLSYIGSQAGNTNLQSSDDITVVQPVIDQASLTKTDRNGLTSPANIVDVANTTMAFQLEACNSGAAPAYSVTVTDALDTTYFDEASISNVGVSIGGAATSNYTYTYSSPTMTFEVNDPVYPGQCVDIDYDIGFRTDFGANQTWNNSFDVSQYWSLQQPDTNGQRYGPVTLPTPFVMTNNANITPPTKALTSPAEATIGEEVVYEIRVPGAVNNTSALYDVAITDPLDANLEYASATVAGLSGSTVTDTSTVGGSSMDIKIDQIPAGEQAIITLHARVRNGANAQQGVDINNTVSYTYANTAGGPTEPALSSSELVTVNIVEPHIPTITKTADKTTATAGEIVRYSVALTAASGTDSSDVFDVTLTDMLDEGLAYAGNPTVTVGTGVGADNTIGAPTITGDGSAGSAQTLVWDLSNSDIDIAEGETVTISYDVRVLDNVLANQTLNNSVVAEWTGRDGQHATATDFERDGSDGIGGLNDYVTAPVTVPITTPDTNTITKTWTSDTYADGAANVRIGDTVDYTLTLSLQEGTLDNLVLADTLPQGLEFAGIVSINGNTGPTYTAVAPFSHTDITSANVTTSGDASVGPSTVTWNLGSVTNAQNDGTNDDFVIVYRARVLNNVFAHTDLNIPLNNTVDMSYDTATGRVTQSDTDTVITALQPQLTVSKSAAAAGGDAVVDGGEVVTYTVDIQNTGTAPAYDVVLQDIIPAGMRTGGITTVNTYLVSSPQAAPGLAFAPAYDPATGVTVWNFDDGSAPSTYAIPAGDTLRVVYSVTVDSDVAAGLTLTNTAQATNYYSLNNDDLSPVDSATYREEYASNTAQASVTTALGSALSKDITQSSAGIGEEFTYTITVPSSANPATTALNDVVIYDNLSVGGADLEFVQADVLPGSGWTGTLQGTVNASGIVEIRNTDAGGIDIPAGGHLLVAITVRLLDTANNNTAGLTFTNRAWYTYSNGATTLGDEASTGATSAPMSVAYPALTMDKIGPSPAEMTVGAAPTTFTLDVQNTGDSDAWDVTVADRLPNPAAGGMCDAGVSNVTAAIYEADGTTLVRALSAGTDYSSSVAPPSTEPYCEFVLSTTGVSIAPTQRLKVTYGATLDSDNVDGATLTNVAGATEWFSADPTGGVYQTYTAQLTDGTLSDNSDHEDAFEVSVVGAVLTAQKSVQNLTTGGSGATASPGDTLRYTITIDNTTASPLSNFSFVDELDRLNAEPMFQPGTLSFVPGASTIGAGVVTVDASGGATHGTGRLEISGLDIGPSATLTIVFDAVLAPAIDSGTIVYNQGQLTSGGAVFGNTDDPALSGTLDPTETLIGSAPAFEVQKTSQDITGDAADLVAGDTLRYTITVRNIGDEDAVNTLLRDPIPANTSYVAGSTTLNGQAVADPAAGVSPLQDGMLINAPADTTAGAMPADVPTNANNVATITFDVVVSSNVVDGTVISNQAFVTADGAGNSGAVAEQRSDDPDTTTLNDPTDDVVGNVPLVDAQKTVQIQQDVNGNGSVDPGDVLRYTITVSNTAATPATGVTLTDAVPANTTYVADSLRVNGAPVGQPDGGISPLAAGIDVSSSDLAAPTPGNGTLSPGGTAVVTFDVQVNAGVAAGTVISNQGTVGTNELADEPTDVDGIDSNGDQPTDIVVGAAQQLSITKSVAVVGGGTAQAGSRVEYTVQVTNIGTVPATAVVITDSIDAASLTYVNGSARLNGGTAGVSYAAPVLTADYSTPHGDLAPGATATLRFTAEISPSLPIGATVTNTADVNWDSPAKNASATATFTVGGQPGAGTLSGRAWLDANYNRTFDSGETLLRGWTAELYRNGQVIGTQTTDDNGLYSFVGLQPNDPATDPYEVRFRAPTAGVNTASLGLGDSAFTNGPQSISNIAVTSGATLQNLNLPAQPNGVVYDSVQRTPLAGATLTMLNGTTGAPLPSSCFDDPAQQGQVTAADGFYRFDLNFSDPSCQAGDDYIINVQQPGAGYVATPSRIIPPTTGADTDPFSVPACLGSANDADPATANLCEAQPSAAAPSLSVAARSVGTRYYLHLTLADGQIPGESQIFNNHIPVDPELDSAVTITKTSSVVNVSRGDLVPYTITVSNTLGILLQDLSVVDTFPAGFKYVSGSAKFDGVKQEPVINGRELRWDNVDLAGDDQHTIKLLFRVGAGVSEAEYVNRAQVLNSLSGQAVSGIATATVRVVPDPTLDCTDVIGKVFDDANRNGYQDEGEKGLPGARVVTARGLVATADEYGRFHITCAVVPNQDRGSNFILKLDDRSLPSGYRVTTENPRVLRATRGKVLKFNFGATIHRVVRLDIADGVFKPDSTDIRLQWLPRFDLLMEQLREKPSILRISYLADVEDQGLVEDRIDAVKEKIQQAWEKVNCCQELMIETEIFWRRGAPPEDLM